MCVRRSAISCCDNAPRSDSTRQSLAKRAHRAVRYLEMLHAAGQRTNFETRRTSQTLSNRMSCTSKELYSVGGREPGRDLEDWLCAEIEVLSAQVRFRTARRSEQY